MALQYLPTSPKQPGNDLLLCLTVCALPQSAAACLAVPLVELEINFSEAFLPTETNKFLNEVLGIIKDSRLKSSVSCVRWVGEGL